MEEEQRTVLQNHTLQIVGGVYMEEKLLSAFLQSGVFTGTMIEAIRAKPTPSDKLYEILFLLPTRGPAAFHSFIEVIQEDYEWLANKLLQAYEEELEKSEAQRREYAEAKKQLRHQVLEPGSSDLEMSYSQASTNSDMLETSSTAVDTTLHHFENLYMKIKMKNSISFFHRGYTDISMGTPQPVSMAMVDKELEELLHRFDDTEHILKHVNGILGINNMTLDPISHIIDLQKTTRKLTNQVREHTEKKNKYCDKINKLENLCRDQSSKIVQLEKEVKKLSAVYKKMHSEHKEATEEKDNQIEELKALSQELEDKNQTYLTEIETCKKEIERLKVENEACNLAVKALEKQKTARQDFNFRKVPKRTETVQGQGQRARVSQPLYIRKQQPTRDTDKWPASSMSHTNNLEGHNMSGGKSLDVKNNNVVNVTNGNNKESSVRRKSHVHEYSGVAGISRAGFQRQVSLHPSPRQQYQMYTSVRNHPQQLCVEGGQNVSKNNNRR